MTPEEAYEQLERLVSWLECGEEDNLPRCSAHVTPRVVTPAERYRPVTGPQFDMVIYGSVMRRRSPRAVLRILLSSSVAEYVRPRRSP